MEKITILNQVQLDGSVVEVVVIDRGNGEFTSMNKLLWDELEAAKENGTISQEYGETLQSWATAQRDDR